MVFLVFDEGNDGAILALGAARIKLEGVSDGFDGTLVSATVQKNKHKAHRDVSKALTEANGVATVRLTEGTEAGVDDWACS